MKCQLKIESDNIMNIRPLYDRIVGKRIEDWKPPGAPLSSPTLPKKNRRRVKF